MCGILPPGRIAPETPPHPSRIRGCIQFSLCYPTLCPQGSVCARTALQVGGSSFLAQVLQDEKWVSMAKKRWHEAPVVIENSQRGLSSNSASEGNSREKAYGHISTVCKWILAFANEAWINQVRTSRSDSGDVLDKAWCQECTLLFSPQEFHIH